MISKIAKYRIDSELGRGGFGRVYQGYDPDVQRPVAIKVLTAESDPELLKRFQAEIGTTGRLRHKNIVTLFECGEQSGVPFLVMELLEGQTLEHVIKNGIALTLLEKVRIMQQVGEGLAYAHSHGVVHRDVKPANIMLLPDGTVKIMDFGIARVADRHTNVTREGFIVGTIPYMAPEQFEGGKADEQTDIFAYGDVYYELLTGRHPFAVDDMYGTIGRIKTIEPESITRLMPECPEALELLVHRAITKDREIRYQSFSELILDGEAVLVDLQRERAFEILLEVRPLIASGDMDQADSKLHQVLELDPGNHEARQLRSRLKNDIRQRGIGKRVAELVSEGAERMRNRQFADAVHSLEAAARLNKTDTAIQQRLQEAQSKLSGYMQANKLLAEARRDQQKGQIVSAIQRLNAALQVDPEHPEAATLVGRLQAELIRRTSEQALQTASALLAQGNYEQAWNAVKDLDSQEAAALRDRIGRERAEAERRKRTEQFNIAVAKIREALDGGELVKAGHLLNYVATQFADEPAAASTVVELQQQLDALSRAQAIAGYIARARDLARQNELRQALDALNEALERFPEDAGLLRMREVAESRYAKQQRDEALADAAAKAKTLRDSGKTEEALDLVRQSIERLGPDSGLVEMGRQFEADLDQQRYVERLNQLLAHAQWLESHSDFEQGIAVLEAAREFSDERELRAVLVRLRAAAAARKEQLAVEASLDEARALEQRGARKEALACLEAVLKHYPGNSALRDAAETLRGRIAGDEQRARIAFHRNAIEDAIRAADWKRAEQAVSRAAREFPGEPIFNGYAEDVQRARFDHNLTEAAAQIRASLARNEIDAAAKQLRRERDAYSDDERWKQLEREVSRRTEYERAVEQAARERVASNLDRAEAMLNRVIAEGAPDDRASRMLEAVRDQRWAEAQAQAQKERDAAERREREEAEQRQRAEAERRKREEEQRLAREEAERQAREDARRAAYEADLLRAEELKNRGETNKAEELLSAVIQRRAPDDRAAHTLTAMREQRLSAQLTDADRAIAREDFQTGFTLIDALRHSAPPEWTARIDEAYRKAKLQESHKKEQELAREREQRQLDIANIAGAVREWLRRDDIPRAAAELDGGRAKFSGEDVWSVLAREIEARRSFLDVLEHAEEARRRGDLDGAEALLKKIDAATAGDRERVAKALQELVAERAAKESIDALERQRREQQEREQRQRSEYERIERERARKEQEVIEARRAEQARNETIQFAAGEEAATRKKGLAPKWIASAIAAALAIGAAIVFIPHLAKRTPSPKPAEMAQFEIRTDPPGANVKVGDHSCVTPNCTLRIAPGHYQIEARLQGYVPLERSVTIRPGDRPLDLTLQPAPVELPKPGAATGTLVVKTGIADARIIVDGTPRGRSDPSGTFTLPLEVKTHDVTVEKLGYVATPRQQTVRISGSASQTLRFRMEPQNATLELRGAPAGVDLSVDGEHIGKTDGSVFTASIKPGERTLRVSFGGATREAPERFDPGQPLALEWPSVAPPLPKAEPKANSAELEAKAWDAVRSSSNPADVEKYLTDFPNGAHKDQAQTRLDDLVWSRTNQSDPQSLQNYRDRFPRGAHVRDATAKLDDLAYRAVNKKDAGALRAFIGQHPDSAHKTEAQNILNQLETDRVAEEQRQQQERAAQQQAQQQLAGQAKAIQAAIDRFNVAFQRGRIRDIKEIWPSIPSIYTNLAPGSKFVMTLRPTGDPTINGNTASIPCELTTETTAQGRTVASPPKAVNVALQKQSEGWIVVNPLR